MKSRNFEILRSTWPELASLGGFAEAYAHADPASALVKLRLFAENLTKDIYRDLGLPKPQLASFVDLLNNQSFSAITPRVVLDKLHAIRMHGNKAAHGDPATTRNALWLLQEAFDLARWLFIQFGKGNASSIPAFAPPPPTGDDDSKGQLKREKRQILEKLAAQEAQMEALLGELETARQTAANAEKKAEELKALASSGAATANLLEFNEATTRARIIDSLLATSGWNVAMGDVSTTEVGKEIEVQHQPTASGLGYADYVLWDDNGNPLAVIEAKKTAVDPERGRQQAKLYADGLEKMHGHRPVIFYTNGYDIWMWDDVLGYPPRKVFGYYSKDSLQYLVNFQRAGRKPLNSLEPNATIVERLYQIEAIKRVSERFSDGHRKALIVQATGTGKTRVAIALADLLIRAGWVKRVLFLCDRRELRKQAKNAFGDFLSEPIRIVSSRVNQSASERVFLATYPAMQTVYQSFDVGFFDLIIADESHRSIYNVYGDMFHYFDCLQIGLTATPVDFVTRSTFSLFNCEGQLPTANYDLEQGVKEGFLTPFEVFEHTTQFLREGIRLDILTKEQIQELEEQGEDPSQYDFSSEQIDKIIYNKDTNRAILRNLMENGLRDATGQLPGKSIVFARNHQHAVLLRQRFDEMYPQYGGRFCQVIDNYDPRAEQLIDDFKGDGANSELTIAISVDMLDTGIDIPEILNLVFAKPVRSPVKFWQMIGRGTRLKPDLFGAGKDKKIFRIFDHWGNFERFDMGYRPAEPVQSKPLLQRVFEERVLLAETALRKSEIAIFDEVINLIAKDIEALPEESVAVREKWREKRAISVPATLKAFAPGTVAMLRQTIAPLMQWRNIRGSAEAHALDLLITRAQIAVLRNSADVADLKIDLLDRVSALQMHLNPVREKAEVIKRVKSDAFWSTVTIADLEAVREPLRSIMHHRDRKGGAPLPAKIIDVTEDAASVQTNRRATNLKTVDMKAYQQIVEAELKRHFDTNPTLRKIRAGEPVLEVDIKALVSLVLIQSPNASREVLEEFFAETAVPLDFAIRSIVGLDPEAVAARFADFARRHPSLTAKQTRFLGLLQNHIARFGSVTLDRLYEQPFTVVDADGLDGVFEKPEEIDDLLDILSDFAPPSGVGANNQEFIRQDRQLMITGDLKRRVDALWLEFWQGGITNPLTVIEQITFLMFARLLDINETRDENRLKRTKKSFQRRFSDEEHSFRWSQFRHLGADAMLPLVRDKVFPHFRKASTSGTAFAEFMKDAQLMIQKPSLLVKAVSMIDQLPLTEGDAKGDLYEYLLSKLTTAGINGQFRTPRHIIRLMVDMLEPKPTDVMGDPACGTGGFLVQTMQHLLETYTSPEGVLEETDPETGKTEKTYTGDLLEEHREHIRSGMFHGFDFDTTMLRIAAMNLMLHGVDDPDIHYQDTLSAGFTDKFPKAASDGFNVILANPPFKGSLDFEDVHPSLLRQVKTKKTELLFLVLILRMLKNGGRSATIVPDGVLFGSSTAHVALRKLLLDHNQLEAVISLPSGVFKPYAGVSTGILVFTKGGRTDDVFFYDVEADGYSLDDKRDPIEANDLPGCLASWRSRDTKHDVDRARKAFFVPAKDIREANYDLSLRKYQVRPHVAQEYEAPAAILDRMKKLNEDIATDLAELEEVLG